MTGVNGKPSHELMIPTEEDFQSLAELQTVAFAEKAGTFESASDIERNNLQTYERYHREYPDKIKQCRVIKCPKDGNTILAACQLSWKRQPNPKKITNPMHTDSHHRIVFIEWIACLPEHMNKGLGTTLIRWAADFAKKEMMVNTLTLYVVKANRRAVRLYKRRGFVEQNSDGTGPPGRLSKLASKITTFLTLGLSRHFTVLTMEKNLTSL